MNDVTLLHGDCLEIMPTLPAQSVQMVFADLPYGITKCKWDTPLNLQSFWNKTKLVSQSPHLTIFTATFQFALTLCASNPRMFRYDLIWLRKRATGFFRAKKAPLRHHEHLLVFAMSDGTYNPIMTEGKNNNTKTKTQKGNIFQTKHEQLKGLHSSSRYPQSSIVIDEGDLRYDALNGRIPGRLHPTQKPLALLEWLIRTYTNPGDTVLDPVAGSGTTAIAAMRTGRKVICIEKDATYFAAMQKRVADERVKMHQQSLISNPAPPVSGHTPAPPASIPLL